MLQYQELQFLFEKKLKINVGISKFYAYLKIFLIFSNFHNITLGFYNQITKIDWIKTSFVVLTLFFSDFSQIFETILRTEKIIPNKTQFLIQIGIYYVLLYSILEKMSFPEKIIINLIVKTIDPFASV